MKACSNAKSEKKKKNCPGIAYFNNLVARQDSIYHRYNNGIEGIRDEAGHLDVHIQFSGYLLLVHTMKPRVMVNGIITDWMMISVCK